MKISQMQVTTVAAPDPPLRNSWGVHEPYFVRVLLKLTTDDGLVGWGEVGGGAAMARQIEAAKQHVLGQSPYNLEPMRLTLRDNKQAFSAIEVACLDIIGKATGQRLVDLLGGQVRAKVPYASYLFYKYADQERDDPWGEVMTPEAMVHEAEMFHEKWGFTTHKVKGGVLPPDEEVRTMILMRERFPTHQLRIDPNAIWSVETSIRVAYKLKDIDLEYLEDPTADNVGMAAVSRTTHIPLSTNMCVTRFEHIPEAVRLNSVQVILGDHHGWGGVRAFVDLGKFCNTFGLGLSQHSNNHLCISMAAMTAVGAAIPNLLYASDSHYPWNTEDIIKGEMMTFTDGCQEVPSGPGLGVEIDEDKVAKLAENFQRRNSLARDDVTEMRKRDPFWLPIKPRW
jgi:glucarate dehydratase